MAALEVIIKALSVAFLILLFVCVWNKVFDDGDIFD
jgi:hypothetical protein